MATAASHRGARRRAALAAIESVTAVAAATGLVALLDRVAPVTGLGVLYLLAVMFIAIRHGGVAALATSVLSVLTLNFLFIEPRYRLTISDSENVVALCVFLIAAVVVGRLAATSRQRAAEADSRAHLAAMREREALMLAEATSSVLGGQDIDTQLARISAAIASSTDGELRIDLARAPAPRGDELHVPLPAEERPGWLYAEPTGGWRRHDLQRVAEPIGRLLDVAVERGRISERTAEAEAVRRADVVKTALLHAVSHDLRSPLTAITTAAQGLRDGELSVADSEALHAVISEESARLARLVEDLLDLSRIEAGAVNPRTDWCDLADVAVSAAENVRDSREAHPIEFDLPAEMPLVQADPVQLERVFSNLIENAVKFSPPGAAVRISGGTGGGRVTVRVSDRGRGIPHSRRRQVFEPFFRGRDAGAGSGLGLAISRGFVEANGGRIQLQGGDGSETSFAVSFPVARQPAEAH